MQKLCWSQAFFPSTTKQIIKEIKEYEEELILDKEIKSWEEQLLDINEENMKIWEKIASLENNPKIKKYKKELYKKYHVGSEGFKKLKIPSKKVIESFLLIDTLYNELRSNSIWDYFHERLKWAKMTPEQRKKRKEEIDKEEREEEKLKKFEANLSEKDLKLRRLALSIIKPFRVRTEFDMIMILRGEMYFEDSLKNMEELLYKAANKKRYFLQAKELIDNYRKAIEEISRKNMPIEDLKYEQENLKYEHKEKTIKKIDELIKKSGALKNIKRVLTKKEYYGDLFKFGFRIYLKRYVNALPIHNK